MLSLVWDLLLCLSGTGSYGEPGKQVVQSATKHNTGNTSSKEQGWSSAWSPQV